MIEVKNLKKVYQSSNFEDVVANNDVSFSLPETGLIFVVGKSGSGKTTLLNMLGGLDKKTSGEIFINGKSIDDFETLDNYRNNSVAFVFQDFNLIGSMNVEQNLKLVLSLQGRVDAGEIKEVLKKVRLEGYESKKINQLSGGQKQRVAIARALIKTSDFILADEPTGNLDKANSKEIFLLLKDISKSKLVIVVSHDEKSAKEFADQTITLADGKVTSIKFSKNAKDCNIDEKTDKNTAKNKKNLKKSEKINQTEENKAESKQNKAAKTGKNHFSRNLNFETKFKMAFSNIGGHVGKSIISIVLCVLTCFSVCLSALFLSYNSEKTLTKTFKNDYSEKYLAQSIYSSGENSAVSYDSYISIDDSFFENAKFKNLTYLRGFNIGVSTSAVDKYLENVFYIIRSKNELEKFDVEFYVANEITDDSIYVTDYVLDYLLKNGYTLGSEKILDYLNMIGKSIMRYDPFLNDYVSVFKIAGIIKTDYREYFDENFELKTDDYHGYRSLEAYYEVVRQKRQTEYIPFFCTENYIKNTTDKTTLNFVSSNLRKIKISDSKNEFSLDFLDIVDQAAFDYDTVLSEGEPLQKSKDIYLNDDEVLVNLKLYNYLFGNEISFEGLTPYMHFNESGNKVCDYEFLHMGEKINVQILSKIDSKLLELNGKKIVGVVIKDYQLQQSDGFEVYTPTKTIKNNILLGNTNNLLKAKFDSFDEFKAVVFDARAEHNIGLFSEIAGSVYAFEQTAKTLSFVFVLFGIVFIAVSILVSILVITFSINSKKHDIGILRALGATSSDVETIFGIESIFVGLTTFVISIIFLSVGIAVINSILSASVFAGIKFLQMSFVSVLISFLLSIVTTILACIIPIKRINKISPVECLGKVIWKNGIDCHVETKFLLAMTC